MQASSNNQGLFFYLAMIALAIMAWFGTEEVTKRLSAAPIRNVPKTAPSTRPIDSKTLYPVLVEFKKTAESKEDAGELGVEAVFNKKEPVVEKKEPALPPVDHVAEIAKSLRLSGIGIDGAFINDSYYRINDPIFEAARTTDTVKIVPKLVRIDREEVGVQIDKKIITIRLTRQ